MKVVQLCMTLCDPMDYIVHGILQARILERAAVPLSRGSSQCRDDVPTRRPISQENHHSKTHMHPSVHCRTTYSSRNTDPGECLHLNNRHTKA